MPEKRAPAGDKQQPNKETLSEDQVKLKPILGIKPGYYLALIYGVILVIIVFLIFINPGIKNPGALISVKTEPLGAAVLVDGVYMNASPCEIFIPKGSRTIELKMPGFVSKLIKKDIGSRLFASAIFPLKFVINEELSPLPSAEAIIDAFVNEAADYAAWSFAGEPSAAYQIPLSLSEGVYRFGPAASNPAVRKSMDDIIHAGSRFAATRAALRDLIRAKTLLDNQGLSPSPLSLLASAGEALAFLSENPGASQWLGETLQGESASVVKSSSWFRASRENKIEGRKTGTLQTYGNLRFTEISYTTILEAGAGQTGRIYIADAPVSVNAWNLFLESKPEWKIENREALVLKGLVDSQYLEDWDLSGQYSGSASAIPAGAAACVSWYAAQAWCEWYSSRLPASEGLEARLPAEAEWELAAKTGLGRRGEFWEWCEDPYAPLGFLSAPAAAINALGSPERSLRGGSWVNTQGSFGIETRASLPPSFCSPFVSFRPVLVPKGSRRLPGGDLP